MLFIEKLRKTRSRLLLAYVLRIGWFASASVFAIVDATHFAVATAILLALVTVPPVLIYTVAVHKACLAVDPTARSAGLMSVVLSTIILTPFESGLILPAHNLLVSWSILRTWENALTNHSNGTTIGAP